MLCVCSLTFTSLDIFMPWREQGELVDAFLIQRSSKTPNLLPQTVFWMAQALVNYMWMGICRNLKFIILKIAEAVFMLLPAPTSLVLLQVTTYTHNKNSGSRAIHLAVVEQFTVNQAACIIFLSSCERWDKQWSSWQSVFWFSCRMQLPLFHWEVILGSVNLLVSFTFFLLGFLKNQEQIFHSGCPHHFGWCSEWYYVMWFMVKHGKICVCLVLIISVLIMRLPGDFCVLTLTIIVQSDIFTTC